MLDLIIENKEWIFSGLGVAILVTLISFMKKKTNEHVNQKLATKNRAQNLQAARDININIGPNHEEKNSFLHQKANLYQNKQIFLVGYDIDVLFGLAMQNLEQEPCTEEYNQLRKLVVSEAKEIEIQIFPPESVSGLTHSKVNSIFEGIQTKVRQQF